MHFNLPLLYCSIFSFHQFNSSYFPIGLEASILSVSPLPIPFYGISGLVWSHLGSKPSIKGTLLLTLSYHVRTDRWGWTQPFAVFSTYLIEYLTLLLWLFYSERQRLWGQSRVLNSAVLPLVFTPQPIKKLFLKTIIFFLLSITVSQAQRNYFKKWY